VFFPLLQIDGSPRADVFTVTADPQLNPQTDGTHLIGGFAIRYKAGTTNNLWPGGYTLSVPGWNSSKHFNVNDTNVVVNICSLVTNIGSYFPVTIGGNAGTNLVSPHSLYVSMSGSSNGQPYRQNLPYRQVTNALAAATAGDTVVVGSGVWTILDTVIPDGVSVIGQGRGSTTFFLPISLTTNAAYTGSGSGFLVGNNQTLSHFSIIVTNDIGGAATNANLYLFPIYSGSTVVTNFLYNDIETIAITDGILLSSARTSGRILNSRFQSDFSAIVINSGSWPDYLNTAANLILIQGCEIDTQSGRTVINGIAPLLGSRLYSVGLGGVNATLVGNSISAVNGAGGNDGIFTFANGYNTYLTVLGNAISSQSTYGGADAINLTPGALCNLLTDASAGTVVPGDNTVTYTSDGRYALAGVVNSPSGVITNAGLVWYAVKTNANPSAVSAPNGSICTTTNGQFYVRSNSVWVLK